MLIRVTCNNYCKKKTKEIEEVMQEGKDWAKQCRELEKKLRKMKDTLSAKEGDVLALQTKVSSQEDRITELLENLAKRNEDSGSVAEKK